MAAGTQQDDREITVVRDQYGWRVEPSRAILRRGAGVKFVNPTGEPIELYFVPGAPVRANDQQGGRIEVGREAILTFSEPGYFPYAVFLTGAQALARGASEPAVIVK